jgi:hypothetical protein
MKSRYGVAILGAGWTFAPAANPLADYNEYEQECE